MRANLLISVVLITLISSGCGNFVTERDDDPGLSTPEFALAVGSEHTVLLTHSCSRSSRYQVDNCDPAAVTDVTLSFDPPGIYEVIETRPNGGVIRAVKEGTTRITASGKIDGESERVSATISAGEIDSLELTGCRTRVEKNYRGFTVQAMSTGLGVPVWVAPERPLLEAASALEGASLEMRVSDYSEEPQQLFQLNLDEGFTGEVNLVSPEVPGFSETIRILDQSEIDGVNLEVGAKNDEGSIVELSIRGTHDGEVLSCALVDLEARTLTPSVCNFSSDVADSPRETADGLVNNIYGYEDGECRIEVEILATGYVETFGFSIPFID